METRETVLAKMDAKKAIKSALAEAGIETKYFNHLTTTYWNNVAGLLQRENGNQAAALTGFVAGLDAAMDRMGNEPYDGYNTLEMSICQRVGVEYPALLGDLTGVMREKSISNSNANFLCENLTFQELKKVGIWFE